jgi:carbon storage regulator
VVPHTRTPGEQEADPAFSLKEEPMLVLSRKRGERIQIGPDVWVTVLRIDGDKVRLGIEAPPDVTVLREELCDGRTANRVSGTCGADRGPTEDSLADGEGLARGA